MIWVTDHAVDRYKQRGGAINEDSKIKKFISNKVMKYENLAKYFGNITVHIAGTPLKAVIQKNDEDNIIVATVVRKDTYSNIVKKTKRRRRYGKE